jgi:hypothetical protein
MKPASIFLILPLALASFAFSAVTPQEPSTHEWRKTERTDAVRGDYARYTLVGKFLQAPAGDSNSRPSLVVDCGTYNRSHKSKFFRGTLVVGDPLKIDWVEPEEIHGIDYFPKVDVVYRLNDAKEDKEQWTPSTDKTSASFSKNSLEKMLHARTLEITAQDKNGSPISMQFDLPDPAPLAQGCEVEPHK